MEGTALVLISISLLLLVLILGLLSFLVFKLFQKKTYEESRYHPEVEERINELKKFSRRNSELFCPNHPEEAGETQCAICDRYFCKSCIKPFKNMHLCKEHFPLLLKNDWEEIVSLKSSAQDPEEGVKLIEFKKDIFVNEKIPTYIETHYKINVDKDHIETYLVLFSLKENSLSLKEKLNQNGLLYKQLS